MMSTNRTGQNRLHWQESCRESFLVRVKFTPVKPVQVSPRLSEQLDSVLSPGKTITNLGLTMQKQSSLEVFLLLAIFQIFTVQLFQLKLLKTNIKMRCTINFFFSFMFLCGTFLNSSASLSKSDSLYASGNYFEASIEYERLIFRSKDLTDINFYKYKKALCYKK